MIALSPYLFIHIGLDIRLLRHVKSGTIEYIQTEAGKLISNLEKAEFAVSNEYNRKLKTYLKTFEQESDKKRILTEDENNALSEIIDSLENIVFAEAQTKTIYILGETRYNIKSLMEQPDKLLGKDVYLKLSPIAKFDLAEGFKCLVFARATAGAFHLLRGTEAVLYDYYKLHVTRGREKTPMWGNMVKGLDMKRKKNQPLLQKLDFIRTNYRNPTAHPDAIYTIETLQDLIGLCIDVINEMARELPQSSL